MTYEPEASVQQLFDAVWEGAEDAVVRLLRAGVPADATDEDGQTPLYRAAVSDELGIVRLLLAAGAEPERLSGHEGGDLPLCGAAVGGHTDVVLALIAAGARPDTAEAFGFTAMTWAVQLGHAATVEALLDHGADPDLPSPGGEPPLVLAARRGSPRTVRALLRHGAGARQAALDEARAWLARDVEKELRAGLLEAYGDGAQTVARRVEEDGGVTVVVEVLREGKPVAGNEQQTGHAAIATLLEEDLGIQTPYATLAERALRCGDRDQDDWVEAVLALWRRGDEETFQAAAAWCASDDPMRQAFAAEVLAQLGPAGPEPDAGAHTRAGAGGHTDAGAGAAAGTAGTAAHRPFAARALPLLRELAREARDEELIRAAVLGLGHHGDPAALPEILRHAGHPDAAVRHDVALSLFGLVPDGHREGTEALIALSRDTDDRVRDWATTALAHLGGDTAEIRETLAARLEDPDPDTAAEAAQGLARRQDPRAVPVLARILADGDPDGYAHEAAAEAVQLIQDETVRRRLEGTVPRVR
ncbi:HEAT repeat domain-containing protein [Streptomyces sp. AM8-1-1]|uniref:HEAT repeat domain-containing protein n=1 Tax=Streptomyces sp. AM8-1-1 TaxID=3075825 RepID=UPI0028C46B66|nr:HEAT repeat domain-containing protein [Streptomyces sp. AM8-1-1]WNO75191.1 HEAT repeat domain-containing protein [Streptomyces sp. AM8-1-1]